MRIMIDPEVCRGHGICYSVAPAVITSDDDGYPVAENSDLQDDRIGAARQAVDRCPERAISLVD